MEDNTNIDWAIGASRQNILNSRNYSPTKFFCFDQTQNIHNNPIGLVMSRSFKFKAEINRIIRHLYEGGFFVKWHRDNKRRRKYEIPFKIPVYLSIEYHGFFMLIMVGAGWSLSILTFYLENFVSKKVNRARTHSKWTQLERFVDGRRHYLTNLTDRRKAAGFTWINN